MIDYYEGVIDVIRDSIESIDRDTYKKLINECTEVLRIDARFLHTNTAVHGDLGMVGKKDLVILLSKGGNTHETVTLAEHLKNRRTNTWLMTFTKECKSAEVVDKRLIMNLENEGDKWNIVPNNSTTVYLIVLQGIAIEIGKRLGITLDDFKVNHPGGGIGAKLSGKNLW